MHPTNTPTRFTHQHAPTNIHPNGAEYVRQGCDWMAGTALTWPLELCADVCHVIFIEQDFDSIERLSGELAQLLGDSEHHAWRDVLVCLRGMRRARPLRTRSHLGRAATGVRGRRECLGWLQCLRSRLAVGTRRAPSQPQTPRDPAGHGWILPGLPCVGEAELKISELWSL